MENLFEKIDRLKAEYEALLPMPEENKRKLDKKIRLEFNFNSNHIEGNTLTYSETELLLIFDETKGDHSMREYEEMKAHDVAFQLIQQWVEDPRPLTEADIKNLNKVLLVRPYWKDAKTPDGQATRRQILVGEYKQHPNSVQLANGEMFEYASPIDTPVLMGELVNWYVEQSSKKDAHPLLLASLLHYRFVCIHPFDDGNGRVSRLLMNYALMKNGYPPVIIKSKDKANYLRALNQADAGDNEAFVKYIGEQLVWSLELCIKAAKGESLEEPDDLDKELVVLQKQLNTKPVVINETSKDSIYSTFKLSVIPLFQAIETKLKILEGNFLDCYRKIVLEIPEKGNVGILIGQKESQWDAIYKGWINYTYSLKIDRLPTISYQYHLDGLNTLVSAPSFTFKLNIIFNKYNYTIGNKIFNYEKKLSPEDIQEIISPIFKHIIEQIKNASQQ